eukprot:TRINITY_DN17518_c0_g1_i1.p1 TRINITY_DN17518_c0_g1~~TRINITY_DN17518_c0_g1_i1.p1  ORF type:complete len:455 (-),score=102.73 TRINITY_DN17518_c0_g1_i1:56-1420(-)
MKHCWRVALLALACVLGGACGKVTWQRAAAQGQRGAAPEEIALDYFLYGEATRTLGHYNTVDLSGEYSTCQLPEEFGTPKTYHSGFNVIVTVDAAVGLHRVNPDTCAQVGPTIDLLMMPLPPYPSGLPILGVDWITEVWEGEHNYGNLFVAYIMDNEECRREDCHALFLADLITGEQESWVRNYPWEPSWCSAIDELWCTTLTLDFNFVYKIPPIAGEPSWVQVAAMGESVGFDQYGVFNALKNQASSAVSMPVTLFRLTLGSWMEVYTIDGMPVDKYLLLGFNRFLNGECAHDCAGKECGENNGCRNPCSTESCGEAYCDKFVCVGECTPDCEGKTCYEDDGCGGKCDVPCYDTAPCWQATTADACAAVTGASCEWCPVYLDYGQCLGAGQCEEVAAVCGEGNEGFCCLDGDLDHFVWCSAAWFKGMMICPPGTACNSAPSELSDGLTCNYAL